MLTVDLIDWLENESGYNVADVRCRRAIGGFSSGGDGAARLAVKNPDLFRAFVSHSGGNALRAMEDWLPYLLDESPQTSPPYTYSPSNGIISDSFVGASMAFSPNPSSTFYQCDFVVTPSGEIDTAIMNNRWLPNHDPATLLSNLITQPDYEPIGIYFDRGNGDFVENTWIRPFTDLFAEELDTLGIPYIYNVLAGGHTVTQERFRAGLLWLNEQFCDTIPSQTVLVTAIDVQGQGGANTIDTPGGSLQMEALITPNDATDASVTWSVTPGTGDASITPDGLLTAMTNGTVTVTATANDGSGVSGSVVITISGQIVLVTAIDVQGQGGANTIDTPGGSLQMEALITPNDATDASVTWSVTPGTGDASITPDGLLIAMTNGTVTVTAMANDGSGVSGSVVIIISGQDVGIDAQTSSSFTFKLHPNPSLGNAVLQINLQTPNKVGLEMYDLLGCKVYALPPTYFAAGKHQLQPDLASLPTGTYLLHLRLSNGASYAAKVLLIK